MRTSKTIIAWAPVLIGLNVLSGCGNEPKIEPVPVIIQGDIELGSQLEVDSFQLKNSDQIEIDQFIWELYTS